MESYKSGCLFFTIYSNQRWLGNFTAKGGDVYISRRVLQTYFSLKVLGMMKLFSVVNFKLVYPRFQ